MLMNNDDNLESFSLVWLDAMVNDTRENIEAQTTLRSSINHLKAYKDMGECEQYIRLVPEGDRVVFIVSGKLGQKVVTSVHELRQISSIYVYCMNKELHERWAQSFAKVRGVFIELNELIIKMQSDHPKRRRNKIDESMSITVFNMAHRNETSTSTLNGQFIHSQLLLDVFIRMKPAETDKNELIELCKELYAGNESQLKIINEFEKTYESEHALWWYTKDSFLYRLVNKALRVLNIHVLFLFRFFIRDIRQELQEIRCSSPLELYRSQLMSNAELQILKNSERNFISINSFMSTTQNRKLAIHFLDDSGVPCHNMERVLFKITADPKFAGDKPFADIQGQSVFPDEEEALIMFGSIFRIDRVNCEKNGIWIVDLVLCTNSNEEFMAIFEYLRKEYAGGHGETDLFCVGQVIRRMGHSNAAQEYFRRCLHELPNSNYYMGSCFYFLAIIANDNGDYDQSLKLHRKSLDFRIQVLKSDDPDLAESYNGMGNVYREKSHYKEAHESYRKALAIWKAGFGDNHPKVAVAYQNIGITYAKQKQFSKALDYYTKALTIRKNQLPSNHPELADSHDHMAHVYCFLGLYDNALQHLDESLRIFHIALPSTHPSIARAYKDRGFIHEKKGNLDEALSNYCQARTIYSQALPSTHPITSDLKKDIDRIQFKLNKKTLHMTQKVFINK